MTPSEIIDTLERSIEEIQTLCLIYGEENDIDQEQDPAIDTTTITKFSLLSRDEYSQAQRLLETLISTPSEISQVPTLCVEIVTRFEGDGMRRDSRMHIRLPPGYPDKSPVVSIVSVAGLNKSEMEDFSVSIKEKALSLAGSEALMELIHHWQDCGEELILSRITKNNEANSKEDERNGAEVTTSRLWLWVHHITNTNRRKDIIEEAKERKLSGYLKHGYPGIVVIEGETKLCDEYVQWIKGNKSRPGGFGRNWGHHVRGQVLLQDEISAAFSNEFEDIGEDLSSLASICRENGVEDEFRQYVMQH